MTGPQEITLTRADPKGLIREAYAIAGITAAECRSIFLDWALSLADSGDTHAALRILLAHHGLRAPDHPMTKVIEDGLHTPLTPQRRGGRAGRVPG